MGFGFLGSSFEWKYASVYPRLEAKTNAPTPPNTHTQHIAFLPEGSCDKPFSFFFEDLMKLNLSLSEVTSMSTYDKEQKYDNTFRSVDRQHFMTSKTEKKCQ